MVRRRAVVLPIQLPRLRRGTKQYRAAQRAARALVHARLPALNRAYGAKHATLAIRNQKRRWGSASQRGTLSFNYRLIYLPEGLADYIIVHELCHLTEMNHSPRFWALVARTIPDWKQRRAALRRYRF